MTFTLFRVTNFSKVGEYPGVAVLNQSKMVIIHFCGQVIQAVSTSLVV